jgi:uncharacterized repeat protein (TIGR03803 family)
MQSKKVSIGLRAAVAIFTVALLATNSWAATKEKVLHSFKFNGKDGLAPIAGLIFDAAGNLYGTTSAGGSAQHGAVFELSPKTGGGWTEKILHTFNDNGTDGYFPDAGLIFDAAGNLYGTTVAGGAHNYGTVFELSPKAGGSWTENVLHSFSYNGTDGSYPYASLIFDAAGNLYGTTGFGGSGACSLGCGTVFELTPAGGGVWTETVLHNFIANGADGTGPDASLIFDASGNLYGTTVTGGANGYGAVFELTPGGANGPDTVLYSFIDNGKDGVEPEASLIFDAAGNLYGTTLFGGAYVYGTVFELTPKAGGGWKETVLHSFDNPAFDGKDGAEPVAGLILDATGNLYGTTTKTGGAYGDGIVFELVRPASGEHWKERLLHTFPSHRFDGTNPSAGLIFDAAGNLYGTTANGGTAGYGTVFELTP